jgi:hypothetical protein
MRDDLAAARRKMPDDLAAHPHLSNLSAAAEKIDHDLVSLQRETARPIPVKFVVRPVPNR